MSTNCSIPSLTYTISIISGLRNFSGTLTPRKIAAKRSLRVLRVRQCRSIAGYDINYLLDRQAGGKHIRSLDLRDSDLIDRSIQVILEDNSTSSSVIQEQPPPPYYIFDVTSINFSYIEDRTNWTALLESRMLEEVAKTELFPFEDDSSKITQQLRDPRFIRSIQPENNINQDLTHLYLSGNDITARALGLLLTNTKLQRLDCGSYA